MINPINRRFINCDIPTMSGEENNISYIKTREGRLKIYTLVTNLGLFICGVCSASCWRSKTFFIWSDCISAIGFLISAVWLTAQYLRKGSASSSYVPPHPMETIMERIFSAALTVLHISTFIACLTWTINAKTWNQQFPSEECNCWIAKQNHEFDEFHPKETYKCTEIIHSPAVLVMATAFALKSLVGHGFDAYFVWKKYLSSNSSPLIWFRTMLSEIHDSTNKEDA